MASSTRHRWDIADVLDRTDLTALLDEHTTSTGVGHRRRWHCPVADHHDHHASVTTHTDARGHQRWRCWSGDDTHRGDAIDLIMITNRLDRADAIEHLARRAGLHHDEPLPPPRHRTAPPGPTGPVPLDPSVNQYVAACEKILWTGPGRPVLDWLTKRGFTEEALRHNHIGADPGRDLLRRPRGLPQGRSIAATFPALDTGGTLTYVQTRYLEPSPGGPKYENPAGRLATNPRLAWTRPVGPSTGEPHLLVCEGIPDALTAAQTGTAAVAVLGAQAPDPRVADQIAQHASNNGLRLVAVIDADDAGRAWGTRLTEQLGERGHPLVVVEPPNGNDLNAWATVDPNWTTTLAPTHVERTRPNPETPSRDQIALP